MKKITLIVPCRNEERGIARVIDQIDTEKLRQAGFTIEVLVIDNHSTDRTAEVAREKGARIVREPKTGKGNAIRTGFQNISKDTDYVVMLDGDDTYKPYEILRLIEPIDSGFADVIIGSRLDGKMNERSMSLSHRLANWFFTFFVRQFYKANVTDTCTGYFAWKREVIDRLCGQIVSEGFAIETEMITKMARLGFQIYSVPITYDPRSGDSKLSPIGDGLRIVWMLIRNLAWKEKT
jgi:glycosyltransferase involved in cell wall biosynthesis